MLDVLKARWQTRGWHPMVKEDSEPMAWEFIKALDRHDIPWERYRELYDRSLDLRSRRLAQGLQCEDFSADMMIACWPSLKTEIREREIAAGRTLTGNAQSQCPDCFGTGIKNVLDPIDGRVIAAGGICTHERAGDIAETVTMPFEAKMPTVSRDETAVEICGRIRRELAYIYATRASEPDTAAAAWGASRTWAHAERYCREMEGV